MISLLSRESKRVPCLTGSWQGISLRASGLGFRGCTGIIFSYSLRGPSKLSLLFPQRLRLGPMRT